MWKKKLIRQYCLTVEPANGLTIQTYTMLYLCSYILVLYRFCYNTWLIRSQTAAVISNPQKLNRPNGAEKEINRGKQVVFWDDDQAPSCPNRSCKH